MFSCITCCHPVSLSGLDLVSVSPWLYLPRSLCSALESLSTLRVDRDVCVRQSPESHRIPLYHRRGSIRSEGRPGVFTTSGSRALLRLGVERVGHRKVSEPGRRGGVKAPVPARDCGTNRSRSGVGRRRTRTSQEQPYFL